MVVGLTGGIGSGKTTVAKMFEDLGVPVYYADDRAKYLMQHDLKLRKELIRLFGTKVFEDNHLNRKYLADIVFADKLKLIELEQIVHPAVRRDFKHWLKIQTKPIVMVENAILHKSGMDTLVDYVVFVTSEKQKRIDRVIKRDKTSLEQISRRIKNQDKEDFLLKKSDFIIDNTFSHTSTEKKVKELYKNLKFMLKKS